MISLSIEKDGDEIAGSVQFHCPCMRGNTCGKVRIPAQMDGVFLSIFDIHSTSGTLSLVYFLSYHVVLGVTRSLFYLIGAQLLRQ